MMTPFTAQGPELEPYLFLEESPLSVAESCRAAGLAFVNGVAEGWGKKDLDRWLAGPYRAAAGDIPGARRGNVHAEWAEPVINARLHGLLGEVRARVLSALARSPDELVSLPAWARTAGSVMRSVHGDGAMGFVPIHWPRMRLEDRVMSLFAVDSLIRPEDYETAIAICGTCSSVSFDAEARSAGACLRHARARVKHGR